MRGVVLSLGRDRAPYAPENVHMADPNYEKGKNDGLTGNPNANPPQTHYEKEQYWKGRGEADYWNSQKPKPQ